MTSPGSGCSGMIASVASVAGVVGIIWIKHYREHGLTGLADAKARSDKGKSRRLPTEAVTLIEGLSKHLEQVAADIRIKSSGEPVFFA
jgi:hypothetical protein